MARKIFIVSILFLATFFAYNFFHSPNKSYVFINETQDHRFDESIRMSILASEKRTHVQNAVVITDNDLTEANAEMLASKLFKDLQIGKDNSGRGILYLYGPTLKILKIEVGYALEGVLPDIEVKGFEMAAKTFTFVDRYQDFWAELINTINIEIFEKENHSQEKSNYDFSKFRFLSGGAGITSKSYQTSLEQLIKESHTSNNKEREKFIANENVELVLNLYLESMNLGIGDYDLDLLSTESRLFRQFTPQTTYQLFRNWRMYNKAGVDRIFKLENLAFIFFKPSQPVLPIILILENGKWKVQEALSWSLFQRFEDSMKVFMKFPFAEIPVEMSTYLNKAMGEPLYPLIKPIAISSLIQKDYSISEVSSLFIHLYWLSKIENILNKKDIATMSVDELFISADTNMNLGKITKFVEYYEAAAKKLPTNETVQRNLKFYKDIASFSDDNWRLKR